MAGPDPAGFDPAAVRAGLRIPMSLGMDPDDPVLFVMTPAVSGSGVDDQGVPWDPTLVGIMPVSGAEVEALCAVEYLGDTNDLTAGVDVQPAKVVITILDEDWEPVSDCIGVKVSGRYYARDRDRPTVGLFSIAVHSIEFVALDV